MNSRPDITLALDVRSYERVVVLFNADSPGDYPPEWLRAQSRHDIDHVIAESVVIVDRLDIQRRALVSLAERGPRLLALVPKGVEHEKSLRRMLSSLYPWSEVWTVSTSLGKALVAKGVTGLPYDRDDVIDARPTAEA